MIEEKFRIRNYLEGDELKIVRLFNETYKEYAGFVPRTCEYWLWNNLHRPDVDREGLIIAENEESSEIVGYAVVGRSGNIWELCVKRNCEEAISALILERVLNYSAKIGADRITLNVPAEDSSVRKMLEALGFVEFPSEEVFIHVMDFVALVKILAMKLGDKLKDCKESILFKLRNAPPSMVAQFVLKAESGTIDLSSNIKSYSIMIEVDVNVLTPILLGTLKPFTALITGRLKIRPFWKTNRSLRLLSVLQVRDPWFHPRADFG